MCVYLYQKTKHLVRVRVESFLTSCPKYLMMGRLQMLKHLAAFLLLHHRRRLRQSQLINK